MSEKRWLPRVFLSKAKLLGRAEGFSIQACSQPTPFTLEEYLSLAESDDLLSAAKEENKILRKALEFYAWGTIILRGEDFFEVEPVIPGLISEPVNPKFQSEFPYRHTAKEALARCRGSKA